MRNAGHACPDSSIQRPQVGQLRFVILSFLTTLFIRLFASSLCRISLYQKTGFADIVYMEADDKLDPEAGWYPDPEFPGEKRYWTGTRWDASNPELVRKETTHLVPLMLAATPYLSQPVSKSPFTFPEWLRRENLIAPLDNPHLRNARRAFFAIAIVSAIFLLFFAGRNVQMNDASRSPDSISTPNLSLPNGLYTMIPTAYTMDKRFCTFTGSPLLLGVGVYTNFPTIELLGRGEAQCGADPRSVTQVRFQVSNGVGFIMTA